MEKTTRFQRFYRVGKRTFTHNLGLKVVSVFLAFSLWYGVTGGPKSERTVTTQLEITNYLPEGYALADNFTREFEVRLSGRDTVLQRLSDNEVSFSLDRTVIEPKTGTQPLKINREDVVTRSGLTVESVTPNQIIISLDKEYSVRRAVQVNLIGDLPEGLRLLYDPPRLNPEFIEISGAERLVEKQEVLFANLDLDEVAVTSPGILTRRVIIEPNPLISYETREIEVELDIVEENAEKSVILTRDNISFVGIDEAREFVNENFRPNRVTVLVRGPESWIETLQDEKIYLLVDLSGAPRETRFEVELTPEMIQLTDPPARQDELVEFQIMLNDPTMALRIDRR